ncbi:MAG: phosphatase PAP2 family protein [Acidimicrobiales bacterium]
MAPADRRGAPGAPGTGWDRASEAGRALAGLDDAADRLFEHVRGQPAADAAALVLSNMADYGFAWAVLAAFEGRHPGPARRRAVRALAVAGITSAAVNMGAKRLVHRQRPETSTGAAARAILPVRRPRSSSFPSGHTLAAFCTAVTLPQGPGEVAACLALAAAIAASRVHLRAHHASDVVGGAVIGTTVGLAARRLVPRTAPAAV